MKKINLVFQDCPTCGSRYYWAIDQYKTALDNDMEIVKTPFYTTLGRELVKKALEKGVEKFPFFTDGEKFGFDINDFVTKTKKKTKKGKK